jgi:hypothetical protein
MENEGRQFNSISLHLTFKEIKNDGLFFIFKKRKEKRKWHSDISSFSPFLYEFVSNETINHYYQKKLNQD